MQLKLIIHCALLFCLGASDSVSHDFNSQKQPGLYNVRPPYTPSPQERIHRSYQTWNQRQPYQLRTQLALQALPQVNHESNSPNNYKKPVLNVPQQLPQVQYPNEYQNYQRIASVVPNSFPNKPNQAIKIFNNFGVQNVPVQKNPHKLSAVKQQANLLSQYKQEFVGNPAALQKTLPRITKQDASTRNVPKTVYALNQNIQKVPGYPTIENIHPRYPTSEAVVKGDVSKVFTPLIPSRPSQTGIVKAQLNEHHVQIIPSTDLKHNKILRVAPVPFQDRYFASASNPVETITRKLIPPNYNMKQFTSNSNIRNILATTKHKKRYLVIHPNGTIEHVEKIETVAERHPNYVLIHAGDIISNPINKVPKVQQVPAVPANKIQNVENSVKPPAAQRLSTLPTNCSHNEKAIPSLVPLKNSSVTSPIAPLSVANATSVHPLPKSSTNSVTKNITSSTTVPSKLKILFSQPSKTNDDVVSSKNQVAPTILGSNISKPIHEEMKVFVDQEKPIINENSELKRAKPIIIFGSNVTNVEDAKKNSTVSAIPAKQVPISKPSVQETTVKAAAGTAPKPDVQPAVKAEAITNTTPNKVMPKEVRNSTSVSNGRKPLLGDVNKETVNSKQFAHLPVASNAKASTNLPIKSNVSSANTTEALTPAPKEQKLPHLPVESNAVAEASTNLPGKANFLSANTTEALKPAPKKQTLANLPGVSNAVAEASNSNPPIRADVSSANTTEALKPAPKEPISDAATTNLPAKDKINKPKTASDVPPKDSDAKPIYPEVRQEDNTPGEQDNTPEAPIIWFRQSDPNFWDKLKGDDKDDVVYFFQIHNQPMIQYNTTRTIHPNGTIVEEVTKYLWEVEGDPPVVTKSVQIINPEDT